MILLITLSLLTCLVGIINAMLMSVTERIKEIGTMKCLGARDEFILKTYFIEAVLQGVLGTAIGMALGLLIAVVVARQTYHGYVSMYMPARAVAGVLLVSILVGSLISILAAIAPARWAARKQPVDAMRVEE
jgi:ABC-type antimicrobial peptide transport system permease subunit